MNPGSGKLLPVGLLNPHVESSCQTGGPAFGLETDFVPLVSLHLTAGLLQLALSRGQITPSSQVPGTLYLAQVPIWLLETESISVVTP